MSDVKKDSITGVCRHWNFVHKDTPERLYLELNSLNQPPTCGCGCGQGVKFLDISRGFSEYAWGHASRVEGKNNWGNNLRAKEKSLETRKEMLRTGEWKPFVEKSTGEHWSKGKTAETDPRIAKAGLTRNTPEYRAISSQRMRENRLNGTIPNLRGPDSSQWKGGISSLNHTCRTNSKLYSEWKYPILKAGNFQCSQCSAIIKLHVHHDKETFSEIYVKIAEKMEWQKKMTQGLNPETDKEMIELKQKISDAVAEYHIQNKVSGVVLCDLCHTNTHDKMNF